VNRYTPSPSKTKRKCRYDWALAEWKEVFTIDTDVVIITPILRPDGGFVTHKVAMDDPMVDIWRGDRHDIYRRTQDEIMDAERVLDRLGVTRGGIGQPMRLAARIRTLAAEIPGIGRND
jgi:hypothetical protein